MEREVAQRAMQELIAKKYQCDIEDIEFPRGFDLGTTWAHGQDFQADYTVSWNGQEFEGRVCWSTVSQEAYF